MSTSVPPSSSDSPIPTDPKEAWRDVSDLSGTVLAIAERLDHIRTVIGYLVEAEEPTRANMLAAEVLLGMVEAEVFELSSVVVARLDALSELHAELEPAPA